MDREQNEALSRLVPFAQAVLVLKDLSEQERVGNRAVAAAQERLDQIRSTQIASEDRTKAAQAKLEEAQAQLAAVNRSIADAQIKAGDIISKAKAEGAAAYKAAYDAREADLVALYRQITAANAQLADLQSRTAEAKTKLAAAHGEIQALKQRFVA